MSTKDIMYVVKRNNKKEPVDFNKITLRIKNLINSDEQILDATLIAQKTIERIHPGIKTELLDEIAAKICANYVTIDPLYSLLGARILISNLHKKTVNSFSEKMNFLSLTNDNICPKFLKFVNENAEKLNKIIDYKRDFYIDFFGFKTLERAYLLRVHNQDESVIVERPQDMWLRVAACIHNNDLENTIKTYDILSNLACTHATPTLFNAGNNKCQLSSCFLLGVQDSLDIIADSWKNVAMISKWGGGIGIHVSNIRADGSLIRGTGGPSTGLVPMLRVFNAIARYVNQGGKRKGSFAIYIEPHHKDIMAFLDLRKNFGVEEERARDLFLGLMISDLFMKQVKNNNDWYLMCPDEAKGLDDLYGPAFEEQYWKYVEEGKYREKLSAQVLFKKIMDSQFETGTPYIIYKDAANKKSNQKNLGVIKSSNLCAEILEYSNDNEHAVCNLSSIALNRCLEFVDFEKSNWTIYSKDSCEYCIWAKKIFESKNVKFEEIKTDKFGLNELLEKHNSNQKLTYPKIVCNDVLIGGFEDFIKFISPKYNFKKLYEISYQLTVNLNRVIDINYYPTEGAKKSNFKHRPVGLGVQGLADTLVQMRIPFDSDEAVELNKKIFATMYYGAIRASCDLAFKRGIKMKKLIFKIECNHEKLEFPELYDSDYYHLDQDINQLYHDVRPMRSELYRKKNYGAYSTFEGSPFSDGLLQFDLWDVKPEEIEFEDFKTDWNQLKQDVKEFGTTNSLLTALMPTASTSQILGNNECFEPFTNNIYTRRTLAGNFTLINKYLVNDLIMIGEWDFEGKVKQLIIANNGSVQKLKNVPTIFKKLYKTVWETKQIWVLKAAAARGPYIDQTQSMNIFMSKPNLSNLYSCHMKSWELGLKTGIYYLRTKPSYDAIKFTVSPELINDNEEEECLNCGS